MPVDTTSYQKYYNALQQAYGKDGAIEKGAFNLGYDDFKQKLSNQEYAQKIYGALDQAYGKQGVVEQGAFTLPFNDFYGKVSKAYTNQPTDNSIPSIRQLAQSINTQDPSIATPMGEVKTSEVDPTTATRKKGLTDQLEAQIKSVSDKWGLDQNAVHKVLLDFPEENDPSVLKERAQLSIDNLQTYNKFLAADQNMHLLAKNAWPHVANAYNELQGSPKKPINSLRDLQTNIGLQRDLIGSNLSGPDAQRALDNLEKNRSSAFNATNRDIADEYNSNEDLKGQLNLMQYAGLKSLESFDPQKYKLYSTLLAPRTDTKDDTVEQKIGLEKVKRELLDIGRRNTANYVNEHQADLDKEYKSIALTPEQRNQYTTSENEIKRLSGQMESIKANPNRTTADVVNYGSLVDQYNKHVDVLKDLSKNGGRVDDLVHQFLHNKAIVDSIDQDVKQDATRFPYLNDLEFDRQARELVGKPGMGAISYALHKLGRGIGSAVKGVQNIDVNLFGTDQDIAEHNLFRLGESAQEQNEFYLPEGYKPEGSPFVYKFDKGLQDQADKITKDKSLTDDQKNSAIVDLVKNNQDQVHTVTNTGKYGKSANLFSKATLYKNAGMLGDLASFAAQQAGYGGLGLPKWIASAAPMFIATQNDFYKQALNEGRPNPMEYANTHAAIMMAAGAINPDLGIVKRSLGLNSELGKTIYGISEKTWNDIVSDNKPLINSIRNSLGGVGKETLKMGLTYGAGTTIASDLADRGLFGSNMSMDEMMDRAVKATKDITTSSIALLGLHAIANFKSISPEEKARVWELGDNPKLAMEKLDESVKSGEITSQVADQRKAVIKKVSKLIDSVPTEDAKGRRLTDQQRSNYLYNLLIKSKSDDIKVDLPETQRERLEATKREVDIDNNAILDPKSEKENLSQRKRELTELLTPDAEGKSNLTPLEKKTHQEELDNINQRLNDINSPKTETNGEETKGNAQAQEIGKPEGAVSQAGAASSIQPISEKIQPVDVFRTWDLGDMEGKPEDAAAKKHIEGVVQAWDKHPAGETGGETFGAFVERVIPAFDKALKEDPHNTTIVTHSSVLKAMRVWDEMGRPDIEKLTPEQKKTFADKYNETETHNGDLETFKGTNGDVNVIRHGQTVDNEKNNFRSGNTNLTEKGIGDASKVGEELASKTGGDVPKVISSDLPRAIHTSNIITDKLNEHASNVRENTGQLPAIGQAREGGQEVGSHDVQQVSGQPSERPSPEQQTGQRIPQEESTGEKATVPPEKGDDWPFVEEPEDNEVTSLKNAVTQQKVEDAGLMPAMKEARREFGEVWDEAQKKLAKGYDIEGLIDNLKKKPRPITDLENAMILYHQNVKESQLVQASKDLDSARASNDRPAWNEAYNTRAKLLDDLQKIYDVDKAVGTANARGLNARKMMADRRFSLVNMQAEKRASNGGEPLTDKQLEEVRKQFEDIKKTKEAYEIRIEELKKETASLEAERNFLKLKGGVKEEKISKKKAEIKKDLADNFSELRKILKEQREKLSANPIPVEAIPVIGKMAKNLVRLGAVKLEEVANHIYNELKGDVEGLTKEHVQEAIDAATNAERLARFKENIVESKLRTEMKTRTGDFSKKTTKPLALDKEAIRLQGEYEKAKSKYEIGLKKDQLAQRTKFQKSVDVFTKWQRAFKLSNPVTLAKLSMAAITRLAQTPIEEGIGGVYSKIIPELAKRAEGEGGVNVKALAKAYREALTTGMKDAYDVMKSGKSNIDYALGKGEQLPPEAIEFFGQLHGAIKAPVKRFAFERSLEKRFSKNIANGVDVTDPEVQTRILTDAYKDAQRAIFMQDNFISKHWTGFIASLERTAAKETNTQLEKTSAKVTAATLQFLVPFVKVPTNIVGETGLMAGGLPIAAAKVIHTAFTKGLSEMSSNEADFVMRAMKKGTLGAGALLLGYFRPDLFGGYYQPYEKRKEGELKAGEMNVSGLHVPIWLLESPIFQTMQLGATIRKAKDKVVKGEEQGIGEGIWAGGLGLIQHEPLIDQPVRVSKLFGKPSERDYYLGELAKSTVDPALLDWAAKLTDSEEKRKPTTILEHVKTGIPGLRETVPTKKESDDRGGDTGGGGSGGGFDR